jgi:hypothetical protein
MRKLYAPSYLLKNALPTTAGLPIYPIHPKERPLLNLFHQLTNPDL